MATQVTTPTRWIPLKLYGKREWYVNVYVREDGSCDTYVKRHGITERHGYKEFPTLDAAKKHFAKKGFHGKA